jgi:hypothetical protein
MAEKPLMLYATFRVRYLKKLYAFALCSLLYAIPAFALTDEQKAARIAFVSEFIRELSAAQELREILAKSSTLDITGPSEIAIILRNSTQASSELGTTRRLLADDQHDPAVDDIRVRLQKTYEQKLTMNQEIIEDATKLLVGGRSDEERNIDYDALANKVSEFNSRNDELDEMIFDMSKDVGVILLDDRETERGLLDHLIVTKAERQKMAKTIEASFKSSRGDKDRDYSTSAAWLIHDEFLKSKFKSADDPR